MDADERVIELAKLIYANSIIIKYEKFTRSEGQKLASFSLETAKIFFEVLDGRQHN